LFEENFDGFGVGIFFNVLIIKCSERFTMIRYCDIEPSLDNEGMYL